MITSTWLCKCGARVKVISQFPKGNLPTTLKTACPKCGEIQIIYGDEILSVTTEEDTGSSN